MRTKIANSMGGLTEAAKPESKLQAKTSTEDLPDFPETVEFKSSRAVIYSFTYRDRRRYEVRHHDADGRQKRASFGGYADAKKHASSVVREMANGGLDMLVLRGAERRAYERAIQLLRPSGQDLDVFVADALKASALLNGDGNVHDAVKYFVTHRPKVLPTISVKAVMEEFIKSRKREEVGSRLFAQRS